MGVLWEGKEKDMREQSRSVEWRRRRFEYILSPRPSSLAEERS